MYEKLGETSHAAKTKNQGWMELAMTGPTQAETIAGMKEQIRSQSIEIKDLKVALQDAQRSNSESVNELSGRVRELTRAVQPMAEIMPELKALLMRAAEVDGMTKMARLLLGGGALVAVGAALAGLFRWFANGGST